MASNLEMILFGQNSMAVNLRQIIFDHLMISVKLNMKLLFFDQKDFSEAENRNDAIIHNTTLYPN